MAIRNDALQQFSFALLQPSEAMDYYSNMSTESRGAVFTRREVVEFILDLAGYTVDQPLHELRLLEPSFGDGDFLVPVVERLLAAYEQRGGDVRIIEPLFNSIRAIEVNIDSISNTRTTLLNVLHAHHINPVDAHKLLDHWIINGDFLLVELTPTFTHVVGNPPYVRQELIPDVLLAEYRARYSTIYDRADLYIPFIERSLRLLAEGGALGFICADRWMKNKYGGPLRAMVASNYHLQYYVDMVDTQAFHSDVIAYPAITIIRRERPGRTRIAHRPNIDQKQLTALSGAMRAETIPAGIGVIEATDVAKNSEPWLLQSFDQLNVVRRLETDFPLIEQVGCKIGIGVATGADRVFIGPFDALDVESDRKLRLVTTKDIEGGVVQWHGLGVINPFLDNGSLVNLTDYPRLAQYFDDHAEVIKNRNCAKNNPKSWYRTIDRIHADLSKRPKLLIPDIKGDANIVYEEGGLYPHHNLYYITTESWDLRALQTVLRSGIAKLFVSIYSTQMRGGYLRFQAQYLRRIRIPRWENVPEKLRATLITLCDSSDKTKLNDAAADLYGLSDEERQAIGAQS